MASQISGNKPMAFAFKKTAPKQPVLAATPSPLSAANLKDASIEAPRIDSILSIEGNQIVTSGPALNEAAPLVIPCERNDWRSEVRKRAMIESDNQSNSATTQDGAPNPIESVSKPAAADDELERKLAVTDAATAEAVRLVLADAAKAASGELPNANGDSVSTATSNVIPLSSQKRPVVDADARPASQDDYERIPVGEFGLAMLRGMGWRENDPKYKKGPAPSDPVVRPRGLGLGADPTVLAAISGPPGKQSKNSSNSSQSASQSQSQSSSAASSIPSLRVGTCVRVRTGAGTRHYGLSRSASDSSGTAVGRVVGLEEEAGRALVQVGDQTLTLSVLALDTISADEFARASRSSSPGRGRGRERDDGDGGGGRGRDEFLQPRPPASVSTSAHSRGKREKEKERDEERRHRHRKDGDGDCKPAERSSSSNRHSHKHHRDDDDDDADDDDKHRHRHHHKH